MVALIVVDVQNDFVEGGALACEGGRSLVPVVNALTKHFAELGAVVCTTQDWHPTNTAHFSKWPVHCLAWSKGAAFADGLNVQPSYAQFKKGMGATDDGYSAFDGYAVIDNHEHTLDAYLKSKGVDHIYVCGIATDYCVKATCLDAVKHGYQVTLINNACVSVAHDSESKAISEMYQAGVQMATIYVKEQ